MTKSCDSVKAVELLDFATAKGFDPKEAVKVVFAAIWLSAVIGFVALGFPLTASLAFG